MRRYWVVAVAGLTLLGALAPPAFAQAPAPKVTITGLIDNLSNYNRNASMNDRLRGGITNTGDDEWYSRTRGRWDIIGELGKAKAVLGLELDLIYGQTGAADACAGQTPVPFVGCRPDGTSGGFDADTDVRNTIELKWMYVEFPFAGPGSLLPFLPVAGTATVGGQPYTVTYKPFIFAASDFGGLNVDLTFTPQVKGQFVFAQFEESSTGIEPASTTTFVRGDDIGLIGALAVTPMKGLDIKPIYSYQQIQGDTSAVIRRGTGGVSVAATDFRIGNTLLIEDRHTIGIDARWTAGPWTLLPTFFYQFGERDRSDGTRARSQDLDAWIFDIQGGYRVGPLNLEARFVATSGNEAKDNIATGDINYYQPFQTGNGYYIGWGEAHGIGLIDYLTSLNGFSNSIALAAQPSYDRYGRVMFSAKATYSLTPALSVYGIVTPSWTMEDVDTRGVIGAAGIAPSTTGQRREESYLGTDVTAGFTWRFAPGLTFDWVYGVLVPGDARDSCRTANCARPEEAQNVYVTTARVRYAF